jgi:hypothetical protein
LNGTSETKNVMILSTIHQTSWFGHLQSISSSAGGCFGGVRFVSSSCQVKGKDSTAAPAPFALTQNHRAMGGTTYGNMLGHVRTYIYMEIHGNINEYNEI